MPTNKKTCKHCKGDKAIRNPKGFCDHLYYPDNCEVCSKCECTNHKRHLEILKELEVMGITIN